MLWFQINTSYLILIWDILYKLIVCLSHDISNINLNYSFISFSQPSLSHIYFINITIKRRKKFKILSINSDLVLYLLMIYEILFDWLIILKSTYILFIIFEVSIVLSKLFICWLMIEYWQQRLAKNADKGNYNY